MGSWCSVEVWTPISGLRSKPGNDASLLRFEALRVGAVDVVAVKGSGVKHNDNSCPLVSSP